MVKESPIKNNRRALGVHLTSTDIFLKYIFPEIKDKLKEYIWVDLYAGEGNLILPILDSLPKQERIPFFKKQIFLFDIQPEMVQKCIINALSHEIPLEIAEKNINVRDNLIDFPEFLKNNDLPIYHITNPPYLYLGYIQKHQETKKHLKYFENDNKGYQDLYQIAMMNDIKGGINDLIYIIPSNFLFGASVSNKFRLDFLKHFKITKMFIFETKMFEFTGTNICIGFFKRKIRPKLENIEFKSEKIKKLDTIFEKKYVLKPKYKYRAGSEFDEFLENYRRIKPIIVKYYLKHDEVEENKGKNEISVIDANKYKNNEYKRRILSINNSLKDKINSNILYVRTVDTGSFDGRVGLGLIEDDFKVQGIFVSTNTYRTHPIQIFLEPQMELKDQTLLKEYFNLILENFRKKLDSEFLTTYKYSNAEYTRKYLGLTQVRGIIETYPSVLNEANKEKLQNLIKSKKIKEILIFLEQ